MQMFDLRHVYNNILSHQHVWINSLNFWIHRFSGSQNFTQNFWVTAHFLSFAHAIYLEEHKKHHDFMYQFSVWLHRMFPKQIYETLN